MLLASVPFLKLYEAKNGRQYDCTPVMREAEKVTGFMSPVGKRVNSSVESKNAVNKNNAL